MCMASFSLDTRRITFHLLFHNAKLKRSWSYFVSLLQHANKCKFFRRQASWPQHLCWQQVDCEDTPIKITSMTHIWLRRRPLPPSICKKRITYFCGVFYAHGCFLSRHDAFFHVFHAAKSNACAQIFPVVSHYGCLMAQRRFFLLTASCPAI